MYSCAGPRRGGAIGAFWPGPPMIKGPEFVLIGTAKKKLYWKRAPKIQNGPGPQISLRGTVRVSPKEKR